VQQKQVRALREMIKIEFSRSLIDGLRENKLAILTALMNNI
jgi:hypothetical protein